MVALERVTVRRSGRALLDAVTLTAEAGRWTALIGPNGAGKTTLLRAAAGAAVDSGTVAVDGRDPRALPVRDRARLLAIVPQSPLLPPDMTVRECVLLGRTAHLGLLGRASARDRAAVAEAVAQLDLTAFADRPLRRLSGGERQRVVLARALAQEAPVLLLDEPTAALDVGRQQKLLDLVAELRAERPLTVLGAMHDLTVAGQYADRLALLDRGRLVAHGAPCDVLSEGTIARHYRARVRVSRAGGTPAVIPTREASA